MRIMKPQQVSVGTVPGPGEPRGLGEPGGPGEPGWLRGNSVVGLAKWGQGGPPPDISCIKPMSTIVIHPINHIVYQVIGQLSYLGDPTLQLWKKLGSFNL